MEEYISHLAAPIEGAQKSMTDAFFDEKGGFRSGSGTKLEALQTRMNQAVTGTNEKDAKAKLEDVKKGGKGSLEELFKIFKTKDKEGNVQTNISHKILQVSEEAARLAAEANKYGRTDTENLQALAKQANAASTDIADKMQQWTATSP